MTQINISVCSNGIHRIAVLDTKDLQLEDYELLRSISILCDQFNQKEVEKA